MPSHVCVKPLLDVPYTDYWPCADGCCGNPVIQYFDFEVGEEYDFEGGDGYSTGVCGRVLVTDNELLEHFIALNEAERTRNETTR